MRSLRRLFPGLPVIMTAADYGPDGEVEARQLGIVQYLHKPYDFRAVAAAAARALVAARTGGPARVVTRPASLRLADILRGGGT